MIEKVKLNEVAKDLNISGKDLTALLQQRFGGEAKKPQPAHILTGIFFCCTVGASFLYDYSSLAGSSSP